MDSDAELELSRRVAQVTGGNVLGLRDILRILGHPDVIEYTKAWMATVDEGPDYKEILGKYIAHVGEAEGIDFLESHYRDGFPDCPEFTDAEWAALQALR